MQDSVIGPLTVVIIFLLFFIGVGSLLADSFFNKQQKNSPQTFGPKDSRYKSYGTYSVRFLDDDNDDLSILSR